MKLISADHMAECLENMKKYGFDSIDLDGMIRGLMEKEPEAVVRCKDCVYRTGTPGNPNILCCQMHDNDFCSYGEKKNEEGKTDY